MLIQLLRFGSSPRDIIYSVIICLFAMTLSFSIHEFMHASVATWLGDPTPRNMGRVTLNPLAHIDPVGTILMLLAGFGWGKPVMYNPSNLHRFKSRRWMNIMVHLAGVTGNFLVAAVASVFHLLFGGLAIAFSGAGNIAFSALSDLMLFTNSFSMMLLAFNLLPIPPLDGFHVLEELLPYKIRYTDGYRKFQQISPMIIWVVFLFGNFTKIDILGKVINLISLPFELLISVIDIPFLYLFEFMGLMV